MDGTAGHLAQIGHRFDRLWEANEPDWVAMPIPEAVKQKLLKLRPHSPPTREFGVVTRKSPLSLSPPLPVCSRKGDREKGEGRQGERETRRRGSAGEDRFSISEGCAVTC